jgi:hypothetical protein
MQLPDELACAEGQNSLRSSDLDISEAGIAELVHNLLAGGAGRGRPTRRAGPIAVTGAFRAEDGWGCPATGPAQRL